MAFSFGSAAKSGAAPAPSAGFTFGGSENTAKPAVGGRCILLFQWVSTHSIYSSFLLFTCFRQSGSAPLNL